MLQKDIESYFGAWLVGFWNKKGALLDALFLLRLFVPFGTKGIVDALKNKQIENQKLNQSY